MVETETKTESLAILCPICYDIPGKLVSERESDDERLVAQQESGDEKLVDGGESGGRGDCVSC